MIHATRILHCPMLHDAQAHDLIHTEFAHRAGDFCKHPNVQYEKCQQHSHAVRNANKLSNNTQTRKQPKTSHRNIYCKKTTNQGSETTKMKYGMTDRNVPCNKMCTLHVASKGSWKLSAT